MNITIETDAGGKRELPLDEAVKFLTARRDDGFEVVVNGELWFRMNRYEDDLPNEYKVSPHASFDGGDYDKDCDFIDVAEDDIRSALEDVA